MRGIERLPEDVINRIAAGEVVQRPSAALKELLENSLDAGSTCIQVVVQDGGLELLQVTDDGHGIRFGDLPLLCERYATSKLRAFDELNNIRSFGFRGEALCSISYVARVTVTTMRHNDTVAWRCHYVDGRMQEEPKPCAGNPGTCIRAEKMFYNAAVRRRAFSRPSEECSRVEDVVSRYALAFPSVAFSCRRSDGSVAGVTKNCVCFPKDSNTLANIRQHWGGEVASRLCEVRCTGESPSEDNCTPESVLATSGPSGEGRFLITGYTSDITLASRKSYLCVFVNNRLVDSTAIRRALDAVYSGVLVRGNRPFTVLFVTVPPDRVDVNIHPTKHEVCLLDEEIIVSQLSECVQGALQASAARRQMDIRQIHSKAVMLGDRESQRSNQPMQPHSSTSPFNPLPTGARGGVAAVAPCSLVRVEPQRGALDAFVRRPKPTAEGNGDAPLRSESIEERAGGGVDAQVRSAGTGSSIKSQDTATGGNFQVARTADDGKAPSGLTCAASSSPAVTTVTDAEASSGSGARGWSENQSTGTLSMTPVLLLDTTDEDGEEVEYTMEHFKKHRKEVQDVVSSVIDTAGVGVGRGASDYIAAEDNKAAASTGDAAVRMVEGADSAGSQEEAGFLLLTSVSTIVSNIRAGTSQTAQSLFQNLAYVGVLKGHLFFAQSGTTLYVVDSLRLVRHVVYQRIFLRWATPSLSTVPQLSFEEPIHLSDLLSFALQNDVQLPPSQKRADGGPGSLLSRLGRRLCNWRYMLQDYFAVEISADGHLIALPLSMGTSWPPPLRAVPLFIWRLAAEVPYNAGEIECFTAIARHIAETLYGVQLHSSWLPNVIKDGIRQDDVPPFCDAIRFGLLPCATNSTFFVPPCDALVDGTVQAVVSVDELYKVFERC
uniref:MLH1 n=1 Tax=Trypanosoma brucei TaxID=5691 RepID=Q9BIX4_9TRYP|nr:MLH1 [Trypanosoma brucei]